MIDDGTHISDGIKGFGGSEAGDGTKAGGGTESGYGMAVAAGRMGGAHGGRRGWPMREQKGEQKVSLMSSLLSF